MNFYSLLQSNIVSLERHRQGRGAKGEFEVDKSLAIQGMVVGI